MNKFLQFCDRALNEQKLVRRLLVLWAVCLITWVSVQIFGDVASITGAASTAFGLVTGLLTIVIGFYQWSRDKEDGQ